MLKGKNVYKCNNCYEKLGDKNKLKYHITKEHIACNICLKIFPTIKSLNIHITAVHDNLITKHQVEKEPSLRIKKVAIKKKKKTRTAKLYQEYFVRPM